MKPLVLCACTYPVHVEGEEDLVHIAVGGLVHALQVQDGLQLEQRDEARRRLSHELVVPVVHVLGQDVVQIRTVVPHQCGPTGKNEEDRGMLLTPQETLSEGETSKRDKVLISNEGLTRGFSSFSQDRKMSVSSSRSRLEDAVTLQSDSKPQDSLTLLGPGGKVK